MMSLARSLVAVSMVFGMMVAGGLALGQAGDPKILPGTTLMQMTCSVGSDVAAKDCQMVPVRPTWVRRPSTHEIDAHYPKLARRRHISGMARLNCKIGSDGTLNICTVVEEAPVSMGFGDAALALAPQYQLALTAGGVSVVGRNVMLPVTFIRH